MLTTSFLLLLALPAQVADQQPVEDQNTPPPQQQPSPLERIVAIVGGSEITLGDVRAEVNRIVPVTFFHARLPEKKKVETYQQALSNLIERTLIHQDALARKLTVSDIELRDEFRKTLAKAGAQYQNINEDEFERLLLDYEAKVRRRILIDKNEARFEKTIPPITEQRLHDLYEMLKPELITPLEARFRHILRKVDPSANRQDAMVIRAEMEEIVARLESGEDFSKLASEVSEDIYASNGGDMGFIRNGSFQVGELNDAAFALTDNETSGILTSLYGFHLLQRVESKAQKPLSFAEAEEELRLHLATQLRATQRQEWMKNMRSQIKVEEIIRLDDPTTYAEEEESI
ncbi:MAG: peptidylprolyl isomerase [Planctomycetes bacterium]|nr:peptidylprolyl isomerase [Planctomycetota bacterium]